MYKLITIDLDGTLLNRYGEVTEYTKNIIKQVTQKGILVVLASGRISESVLTIAKEIGANKYYISGNGSVLYDMKKNEILYENYLNKEKVLEIIELCEKNSIYFRIRFFHPILAKTTTVHCASAASIALASWSGHDVPLPPQSTPFSVFATSSARCPITKREIPCKFPLQPP